jgi:hypothetical protein
MAVKLPLSCRLRALIKMLEKKVAEVLNLCRKINSASGMVIARHEGANSSSARVRR